MIRAGFFYAGYVVLTVVWGTLGLLVGWALPYRARFAFIISAWTGMVLAWLRLTCGVRHRITGLENIPDTPCIVFCKHESTWETLFLQQLFAPQATLIKRELLHIPFFGWAFRLLRPIAIDRSAGRDALKYLIREGQSRLADDIWVVLFPEGTRLKPGEIGRFQPGGAALAAAGDTPILVIAHNAGEHWPAHRYIKRPGVIDVHIGPPLDTQGLRAKEINDQALALMQRLVDQTSRLTTDSALVSMNSRRGST